MLKVPLGELHAEVSTSSLASELSFLLSLCAVADESK